MTLKRTEVPVKTFEDLPEMLRVEEAAEVLRISRTRAYEEVSRYQNSAGGFGLPSIRIGRSLRVPKKALIRWIDEQIGESEIGS